jgi:hypothetical protein
VPVRDCERQFAAAASADGISLASVRVPWLNQRGHLALPPELVEVRALLERIFLALGGDLSTQAVKKTTPLPGDFVLDDAVTLVEIDESQHFTSYRALTLDLYPPTAPLGFDIDRYRVLCETLAPISDKYRRSKAAVGFGPAGRSGSGRITTRSATSPSRLWAGRR